MGWDFAARSRVKWRTGLTALEDLPAIGRKIGLIHSLPRVYRAHAAPLPRKLFRILFLDYKTASGRGRRTARSVAHRERLELAAT